MRLRAGCPRCSARVTGSESSWTCPDHGPVVPLWRTAEASYDAFAEHLVMSRPLPSWLPWPLPLGWRLTDFGCVGGEGRRPAAAYVTCTGLSDEGRVELTVLTEEPGVGLGARCGGLVHADPQLDDDAPPLRLHVDGNSVPVWLVPISTDGTGSDRTGFAATLDRSVFAGEAQGRWLWLVVRPAPAALLLQDTAGLYDVAGLGPELMELPFGGRSTSW